MYGLQGRTVLLTGGATGIGRGMATLFAKEGCNVGIFDLNVIEAKKTAAIVQEHGRKSEVFSVDVSDFDQVAKAIDQFVATFGQLDVLINNAGIVHVGTVEQTKHEDWRRVFQVNVDGPFNCSKIATPHLIKSGHGKIINTASYFGKVGKAYYSAYCASKFAVIGLTQSLALELAQHRVNVNAICPGTVAGTEMRAAADVQSKQLGIPSGVERSVAIPLGRMGSTDDIAQVAAFLASDAASYMTGQSINVTGGMWFN